MILFIVISKFILNVTYHQEKKITKLFITTSVHHLSVIHYSFKNILWCSSIVSFSCKVNIKNHFCKSVFLCLLMTLRFSIINLECYHLKFYIFHQNFIMNHFDTSTYELFFIRSYYLQTWLSFFLILKDISSS